jgi:hypothetical protein
MQTIQKSEAFELAYQYVTGTNQHVFLTGKAGTGKTTFLHYLKQNTTKNMIVAAPTGVAAINAGGVTLHSLFQLPFSPFIPTVQGTGWGGRQEGVEDAASFIAKIKMNKKRLSILRKLELLVIDEISMVRADVLDAIDTLLKHVRRNHHQAFGGVQLLMIGDLYQLPPVAREQEWNILSPYYSCPFFFASKIMQTQEPICIELTTIYRQKASEFIEVLNAIRNNEATQEHINTLNTRYDPTADLSNCITITSHNAQADGINSHKLAELETRSHTYHAAIEGEFSEYNYPADKAMVLKKGAQVMFVKNDPSPDKKFFNGKIGKIVNLDADSITVQCPNDDDTISVPREKWDNIKYDMAADGNTLNENVVGSFTQFPLRLAWAVTIHKSQGLTFEKCGIDAARSFASGQLYVALSRCTSLQGIVLLSPISSQAIITDEHVVAFHKTMDMQQVANQLQASQEDFMAQQLAAYFMFTPMKHHAENMLKLAAMHRGQFSASHMAQLDSWYAQCQYWVKLSSQFLPEMQLLAQQGVSNNGALHQRLQKAAAYFVPQLLGCMQALQNHSIIIDSKPVAIELQEEMLALQEALSNNMQLWQQLQFPITSDQLILHKRNIVAPKPLPSCYAGKGKEKAPPEVLEHGVGLYGALIDVRNKFCEDSDSPVYLVANKASIIEMCNYLPQNEKELENITGFGKTKVKNFGTEFLEAIISFSRQHSLRSNMANHPKLAKNQKKEKNAEDRKTNLSNIATVGMNTTSLESFTLFSDGFTILQIAEKRNMATSTIEGHLALAISSGKLKLIQVMDAVKGLAILDAVKNNPDSSYTTIKNKLGSQYSFGEVKMGMAQAEWNKSS